MVNITSGNVEIKIQNDKLGNVASMIRLPDNKTFLLGIGVQVIVCLIMKQLFIQL